MTGRKSCKRRKDFQRRKSNMKIDAETLERLNDLTRGDPDVEVTLSAEVCQDLESALENDSLKHFIKWTKTDDGGKVWSCGVCGKRFTHQYTLMRHVPIHTDERNFKCEICGKAFRQASTLCRHKAIHSDARPFYCTVCNKAFNRSSTLIAHRKTHSKLKPHVCDLCGKSFHQKGNLKNHMFTHTDERPYKCHQCGKGFNQMSNLVCHKAHAHVEKPKHLCRFCNKEFPRKFGLRSHEEYAHGIKYDVAGQEILVSNVTQRIAKGRHIGCVSKTVTLPNGDKTIKFLTTSSETETVPADKSPEEPIVEILPPSGKTITTNDVESSTVTLGNSTTVLTKGILIEPISTPAMVSAQQNRQIPFALLKPEKGTSVLVKILSTSDGKQVLVPATADDLRLSGKISVSPSLGQVNGSTIKAVQIKVPVVATITQKTVNDQLVMEITVDAPSSISERVVDSNINSISKNNVEKIRTIEASIPCEENREDRTVDSVNAGDALCKNAHAADTLDPGNSDKRISDDPNLETMIVDNVVELDETVVVSDVVESISTVVVNQSLDLPT